MNNDIDMSIAPKSDQLNYDDFLTGDKTIIITNVTEKKNDQQPVSVHYQGDNGKPYKPCKSMRRVMVIVWGGEAKKYVGKSMTLYGDPEVTFGNQKVGGIRISYMSHIDKEYIVSLTTSKLKRSPHTVKPLKDDLDKLLDTDRIDEETHKKADDYADLYHRAQERAFQGLGVYQEFFLSLSARDKKLLTEKGDHEKFKKTASGVKSEKPSNDNEESANDNIK